MLLVLAASHLGVHTGQQVPVVELLAALGPGEHELDHLGLAGSAERCYITLTDEFAGDFPTISINFDPVTGEIGIVKFSSGKAQ